MCSLVAVLFDTVYQNRFMVYIWRSIMRAEKQNRTSPYDIKACPMLLDMLRTTLSRPEFRTSSRWNRTWFHVAPAAVAVCYWVYQNGNLLAMEWRILNIIRIYIRYGHKVKIWRWEGMCSEGEVVICPLILPYWKMTWYHLLTCLIQWIMENW